MARTRWITVDKFRVRDNHTTPSAVEAALSTLEQRGQVVLEQTWQYAENYDRTHHVRLGSDSTMGSSVVESSGLISRRSRVSIPALIDRPDVPAIVPRRPLWTTSTAFGHNATLREVPSPDPSTHDERPTSQGASQALRPLTMLGRFGHDDHRFDPADVVVHRRKATRFTVRRPATTPQITSRTVAARRVKAVLDARRLPVKGHVREAPSRRRTFERGRRDRS